MSKIDMNKDEALKLALEHLKDNQHLIAEHERHAYVMEYNAVIERVEEALAAQPTGKEPCERHCEANAFRIEIRGLRKQLEAPQPAPKPLTDDQIGVAFRSVFPVGGVIFTTGAIAFAKAIEAAHNIRG